ncbi:SDR family oxidoreductase [Glaciihabitans sp. UYNi722]|uniref:SDR family NAD(P)-dependent oxidoreductase n=1 Tax=Glaciihabitans sp. UYNi722 TaxID=3156344 RepID=UPI003395A7A3
MTFEPMGTTALVTGASSGLGVEFAHRLAERGADLVLVARREDRLEALATELRTSYGTVCTVIPLDLTGPDAVAMLVRKLTDADIRISTLVNNAGFGTHGFFAELAPERELAEIQLNVAALVALSRAFLPQLIEAGNGALVNVASTAAFQPIPRMAVYGATKAFVLSFTEALWYETKGTGLKVLALCPGPASTEFFDVAHNEDAVFGKFETAEQVIATAMKALDRRRSPASVISGRMNAVQAKGVGFAPRGLVLDIVGRGGAPKKR